MALEDLQPTRRIRVPGSAMRWSAVRASGPGGQNVNKRATKVELRVVVDEIEGLDPAARERLRGLAGHRWIEGGELRVVSEQGRSQAHNLELALATVTDLLQRCAKAPKKRKATRPSLGAKRRRLEAKRQRSERKRGRGRVDPSD